MGQSLRDTYPDTYALGSDSLNKVDGLLERIEAWKEDRFQGAFEQMKIKFDEDLRTALIIRSLEKQEIPGLPSNDIIQAMFDIIDSSALMTMHLLAEEEIRI